MIVALFLIFALLFGFAVQWLWYAAVIYLLFWIVGVAIGRGERAGHNRFYYS